MAESTDTRPSRGRWAIASATALAMAVAGIVVVAITSKGYSAYDTVLNDGGIWVTSSEDGAYGRVNKPIGQLDGALFADDGAQLDVVQEGDTVVGIDVGSNTMAPIDPATVTNPAGNSARIVPGSSVQVRGGTLAVLDPVEGRLWAERTGAVQGPLPVSGFDTEAEPLSVLGGQSALAVSSSGEVFTSTPRAEELQHFVIERDLLVATEAIPLSEPVEEPALTSVGLTPVVVEQGTGALQTGEGVSAEIPVGSRLQESGAPAQEVVAATADRLLGVDLASGRVREIVGEGAGGSPAAPVRVGACVYGAWSGSGSGSEAVVATQCGTEDAVLAPLGEATTNLVFRVNRGQILLNDRTTGAVWSLDQAVPTRIDDWQDFQSKAVITEEDNDQDDQTTGEDRRPPSAEPDEFGARLDRTTVLRPLDNDTAPKGRLLAITSITAPRGSGADLAISPDGQTVQIRLPENAGTSTFDYTVDDGRAGLTDTASVTVTPRPDGVNEPPALREGFEPIDWKVPAGGVLDLPVLADWRDAADGDLLSLETATVDVEGAAARPTAGGRIRLTAPPTSGTATVTYAVGDGVGEPTTEKIEVEIQSLDDPSTTPATPEPDVVSGEAGRPLIIRPLANDLPGSDPFTPDALVELAGKVADKDGVTVTTDLVSGTLTVRADQARTYLLDYDVKYGNAGFERGLIRVDMRAPVDSPPPPVAMPDTATVFGQAPVLVDVLANDVDPSGGLLVVETGTADSETQLDVAVVKGRWLRISASEGELNPNPQVVRYTVSNGVAAPVAGEVLVTSRSVDQIDDPSPVTEVDRVTVREGNSVSIPVLDNDFSPLGDELTLLSTIRGESAGELTVRRPGDDEGPTGEAFLSGRFVRYVAPLGLDDAQTFSARYVATDSAGRAAPGRLEISVIPASRDNRNPEPPTVEGRVVAGDTLTLRLPGSGADPDGDDVSITSIAIPPSLGRVVSFAATSVEYQPFPSSIGTDEFQYEVTDSLGATGTGTIRTAIVRPNESAPPLAVDDAVILEPGRIARVDVLANDLVSDSNRVSVRLIRPAEGVELASPTGPVIAAAPARVGGRNVEVVYEVDNGVEASRATLTLRSADPYNLPPVVFDSFVENQEDQTAAIDVLESAYDPDGETGSLQVTKVFAPPGSDASIQPDGRVRVTRGEVPLVVPFRVEDADGGAATASVFVPALESPDPRLIPGASIDLAAGSRDVFDLADYVEDPAGGTVALTLKERVSTSPATRLSANIDTVDSFTLAAPSERFAGPGAVTLEVSTGSSVNDASGATALVTIPVQVGLTKTILNCDQESIEIVQGQQIDLDIGARCRPFTSDPAIASSLTYEADWRGESPQGLSIADSGGSQITVAADSAAPAGSKGVLEVTAGDSDPGKISVNVVAAPAPRLASINVGDLAPGEARTIDVSRYLRSNLPDPDPSVVTVTQINDGPRVRVDNRGSQVTLRTGAEGGGEVRLRLVVSDVTPAQGGQRQTTGLITAQVLGRPEAPTAPAPGLTQRDSEVALSWKAPEDNGSPITGYDVRGGGVTQQCGSTTCEIGRLTNGQSYRFEVRARNAVGVSPWSGRSKPATPDARPGEVGPIRLIKTGDRQLTLQWSPPQTKSSQVTYDVVWPGAGTGNRVSTKSTRTVVSGLDNNRAYKFSVRATNASSQTGPTRTSAPFQSIGQPGTPKQAPPRDQNALGDTGAVTLSWSKVNPNGPEPVRYTVFRNGKALANCAGIVRLTCDNSGMPYDGATYQYTVQATNAGGKGLTSAKSAPKAYKAVGTPAEFGLLSWAPTGKNRQIQLSFTQPDSRGAQSIGRIVKDGVVSGYRFSGEGTYNRTIRVDSNDSEHNVGARLCNESGRCSYANAVRVQTYGPLVPRHIVSVKSEVRDRKRVRWVVTVDSNGKDAEVKLDVQSYPKCDGGTCTGIYATPYFQTVRGPGVSTLTTGWDFVGYEGTSKIKVTLRDRNPNRGEVNKSDQITTARKPRNANATVNQRCVVADACGPTGPQP